MKLKISLIFLFLTLAGCTLSPGMHMNDDGWLGNNKVYFKSLSNKPINIEDIDSNLIIKLSGLKSNSDFKINVGDSLAVVVWSQKELMPTSGSTSDPLINRVVKEDGTIFYPYIGKIRVKGLTTNEVREIISTGLSRTFNNPQIDVNATFAQRKIYVVGEVIRPETIDLGQKSISLSDAIARAGGISSNTSDGSRVYVIRKGNEFEEARIFRANLETPAGFILTSQFNLESQDVVFVGPADITRWNRVIAQFFPFTSFINAVDNISNND